MALHLVTRGLGRLRSLLAVTWGLGRSPSGNLPPVYVGRAVMDHAVCTAVMGHASTSAVTSHASARATTNHTAGMAVMSSSSTSAVQDGTQTHG